MVSYVVDIDICIYTMQGLPDALAFWESHEQQTFLFSVVTKAELLSHPALTEEDRTRIDTFLASGSLVDVDEVIAEKTGELRRRLARQGRKLRLPDALIAATAVTEGAILVTHNVRDYRAVSEVAPLHIKDPITAGSDRSSPAS